MLKTAVFKYKLVVGVGWRVLLIFVLFFVLFLSDCNFCQMTILVFIKLKIARFDFAIHAGNRARVCQGLLENLRSRFAHKKNATVNFLEGLECALHKTYTLNATLHIS